ncbi:ferrous iron transport protein B [Holophaga foetida]|uniref:ferrous iron transport protein B n=1 Tax=Holophaga foetida TaxID=35839 RepID=UPI00024717E5|nr:ferrous iron transport protein B [Holophaga foetida]
MVTIALAGNPNCGKTSLFNALTGARQHVGNWPGVTVERRAGTFRFEKGEEGTVVDLPGTYSLSARSEDERIAASYLSEPEVDVIVNVVDATNLERNLYLTTQLLELKRPMILVLNMADEAKAQGLELDLETMRKLIGGPVVTTVGSTGEGLEALKAAVLEVAPGTSAPTMPHVNYGLDIEGEVAKLELEISRDEKLAATMPPRRLSLRLLEGAPDALEMVERSHASKAIQARLESSLAFLDDHLGADAPTLLAEYRYGFARGLVKESVKRGETPALDRSSRMDRVLTHRFWGFPIFLAVMVAVYSLTFVVGAYPQDWIGTGFEWLQAFLGSHLPEGELTSLLANGIVPGVGSVVVFLPVIMILMGCISFLEDSGYMARAAFIMDRLMHKMGLHGKSFISLIMGLGCNAPAIQATRTIEARSDRLITILVNPLISCSARLPVYILFAGAFFSPFHGALVIVGMHVLGFALAIIMGKVLRLTLFRQDQAPFVMELPPYRMPLPRTTILHMWEKGTIFLRKAGTVIFAGAVLIWFLSQYPGINDKSLAIERHKQEEQIKAQGLAPEAEKAAIDDLEFAHQGRIMNNSYAARFGQLVQPIFRPILDPDHRRPEAWKDGVALTAGFVAKEIVVGTMGVLNQAREEGEEGQLSPLQQNLRDNSGLTPLTAIAFMVFTLIYIPCLGTVGIIRKETQSWGWTGFSVGYGLVLAWVLSWLIVTLGRALGLG